LELYFFRNIINYEELLGKTVKAYKRNSKNKREVIIVKRVELKGEEAIYTFNNLRNDNHYIIDNVQAMMIKNGIWHCLELVSLDKSILVMSGGFPYAKFVATRLNS
jgi:hypothetical protein